MKPNTQSPIPKFCIDEKVIFFDRINGEFDEGYIIAYTIYADARQLTIGYNVGIPTGKIGPDGSDEYKVMTQVCENNIFKTRKEAMQWINNTKFNLVQ